ncbi:MAG: hypothetical protein P1V81_04850 [Planctomycetota bacterium]|nr:hypothetical protein [Planctomycetota bacterium]
MAPFQARALPIAAASIAFAFSVTPSGAQSCDLVYDFNQDASPRSSNPEAARLIDGVPVAPGGFVPMGGAWYFRATTQLEGTELWRTDGTAAGTQLVADIAPGPVGSDPAGFTVHAGLLYFQARTDAEGVELWRSDGTAAGTSLVTDLEPGPGSSSPINLTTVGSGLCFSAEALGKGPEPWVTDGTPAGTVQLADTLPGSTGGGLLRPTTGTSSGVALFHAVGVDFFGSTQPSLWRTDGTQAGTTQLLVLPGTTLASSVSSSIEYGGAIYLVVDTLGHGRELWRSDGTVAGTTLFHELAPGQDDGLAAFGPGSMAVYGGLLYFVGSDAAGVGQLWRTDGTPAGTLPATDAGGGAVGSEPMELTLAAGRLFFTARDAAAGRELWSVAGTSIQRVADGFPGPADGVLPGAGQLVDLGTELAYIGFGFLTGFEPFHSDGTAAGTGLLADTTPGFDLLIPSDLTAGAAGGLLFAHEDASSGRELWASDGTAPGTGMLVDVAPGSVTAGSTFSEVFAHNASQLYLGALGAEGVELWSWSPAGGAQLVKDIRPGSLGSAPVEFYDAWMGDHQVTLFSAEDASGRELWRTDGTAAGTLQVADLDAGPGGSSPMGFCSDGSRTYFSATTPGLGRELWVTDGTAAGTSLVVDLRPGPEGSSPHSFVALDGRVLFVADDGVHQSELWSTDGTAAGTVLLKDTHPTSDYVPADLTRLGDLVLFSADDAAAGRELWRTDGTAAGTFLLKDIDAGAAEGRPRHFARLGDHVYFQARSFATGVELFRSDGTAAGTQLVLEIQPGVGSLGGYPEDLTAAGDRLYFSGWTKSPGGASSYQLYVSDGTAAGTTVLTDFPLDTTHFQDTAYELVTAGAGCYFVPGLSAGVENHELHFTDGTVAGTQLVCELTFGPVSSAFEDLTFAGGQLLFTGIDPSVGRELFTISSPGAQSLDLGPASSTPVLDVTAPVLGGSVTATVRQAPAGSVGVLVLGAPTVTPTSALVLPDTAAWIDPIGFSLLQVFAGSPFSASFSIPAAPLLDGVSVNLQAWFLPAGQPLPAATSNGVRLVIGS